MIDIDRIEKYILGGKWENQYPQVIEELLAEVKRLREEKEFLMRIDREATKENLKVYEENDNLMKLCIERYAEIKRLREESKKKGNVLSTLDEMIRNEESHVEMMKALEQGLDLPETWKEMVE